MIVFNLSKSEITYKGRKIAPEGGSTEFPELSFIPTRDRELEAAKVLAFGELPKWWHTQQSLKSTVKQQAVVTVVKGVEVSRNVDSFPVVPATLHITRDVEHSTQPTKSFSMSTKKK